MLAATCAPDPCKNSVPPPSRDALPNALPKVGAAMPLEAPSTACAGLKNLPILAPAPAAPSSAPSPAPKARPGAFCKLYSCAF